MMLSLQLLLLSVLSLAAPSPVYTIRIDSQDAFDSMQASFDEAVRRGKKEICISLASGRYYFKEDHLSLINRRLDDVSLTIEGEGTIITAVGETTASGDSIDLRSSYIRNSRTLPKFSKAFKASSLASHVDGDLYRIRCKELARSRPVPEYIKLTESYMAHDYRVEKVRGDYVYFHCDNPEWLNKDMTFGRQFPRIKYSLRPGGGGVHKCNACCFLYLYGSSLKSFTLHRLCFEGNAERLYKSLIRTIKTDCGTFCVTGCRFSLLAGALWEANSTSGICFRSNAVFSCEGFGLTADASCPGVVVEKNRFDRCGLGMGPSFCVCVRGENYQVRGNEFRNFGYCAVAAGVYYKDEIPTRSCGVIEGNEMYYSSDYIADIEDYALMDGGAVYLFTRNDGVIIRDNYIHDIDGRFKNRGIFCDDGAYGFTITGNTILNIANSYCIDSRRCPEFEQANNPDSRALRTNVNNSIFDNTMDGDILFVPREGEDNGCDLGENKRFAK